MNRPVTTRYAAKEVGISLMTLQRWIANEDIGPEAANCEWAGNEDLGGGLFGAFTSGEGKNLLPRSRPEERIPL